MMKKIGIVTLALSFIAVGTLFLLNNFIHFNIPFVLSILWPVILIVLGIEFVTAFILAKKKNEEGNLAISLKCIFTILILCGFVGFMGLGIFEVTENGIAYNQDVIRIETSNQ